MITVKSPYSRAFKAMLTITAFLFSSLVSANDYVVKTLNSELNKPWAMAILDNGEMLITERSGQLRLFAGGQLSKPFSGVPEVFFAGQGGLLDVAIIKDDGKKVELLLSYAKGPAKANALTLYRAEWIKGSTSLINGQEIFSAYPKKSTPVHYGGRIAFMPNGSLFLTSGDGYNYREAAQDKSSHLGKVLRLNIDGTAYKDNPFYCDGKNSQSYVWTIGHRNPQAIFYDTHSANVYMHEHGPKGGDEINILEKGLNYGWPVITYGVDYSGARISPFTEYKGMEQPWVNWTPSIAPSDMILYRGNLFPNLKGKLIVTALAAREVRVVSVAGAKKKQSTLFEAMNERFRAIEQDKSGNVFLLTDSGKLLQIELEN